VEFLLCDYRDIPTTEKYDRIVSVGFMEHVGRFNFRTLYSVAEKVLVDDGIFLLHTMGNNRPDMPSTIKWFDTYIFPNSEMPPFVRLLADSEGLFYVEDIHTFGADYEKTLKAWEDNFDAGWPQIKDKYGERFYRIWKTYLQTSQGVLGARLYNVYQIVFSKKGIQGGYQSVR